MNISEDLKKQAIDLGLCEQWTNTWSDKLDKEFLVMKYVKGIKWCMDNHFPTIKYMVENFTGVMKKYGVYISELLNIENEPTIILKGECEADLVYDNYNVGTIWIGDNSNVKMKVSENAIVYIHTYDKCSLQICAVDKSKVIIYNHGGCVAHSGNVEIINAD